MPVCLGRAVDACRVPSVSSKGARPLGSVCCLPVPGRGDEVSAGHPVPCLLPPKARVPVYASACSYRSPETPALYILTLLNIPSST